MKNREHRNEEERERKRIGRERNRGIRKREREKEKIKGTRQPHFPPIPPVRPDPAPRNRASESVHPPPLLVVLPSSNVLSGSLIFMADIKSSQLSPRTSLILITPALSPSCIVVCVFGGITFPGFERRQVNASTNQIDPGRLSLASRPISVSRQNNGGL